MRPSAAGLISAGLCLGSGAAPAVEIFGWSEPVALPGVGLALEAKLDTGADTSSLDAVAIRVLRRNGRRVVRFRVRDPASGDTIDLERDFVRSSRIRQHFGDFQRRRVVEMEICLGGIRQSIEVNLVDRSNFSHPLLLGRNALAGVALVDSSLTDTSTPDCPEHEPGTTLQ